MKAKTTEQFIQESKNKFGNKYNYSKTIYINAITEVCIICPEHGEFWQIPRTHLRSSQGCPECARKYKNYTTDSFIKKANEIHNNKYTYNKTIYNGGRNNVVITCPIHGDFEQKPIYHLQGHGCSKCGKVYQYNSREFIEKAKSIHGDKYNYNNVNYVNTSTLIDIICPTHGKFSQTPECHLRGQGCPKCGKEKVKKELSLTSIQFIEKAHKVHGDKYDYSKVIYINNKTPVIITCPIHGDFEQRPDSHLNNRGCSKCEHSKGEMEIELYLKQNNINFIPQHKIPIDKSINSSGIAKIDFYLPNYNLFIEYNGEQHYVPIDYFGGQITFEHQQERDQYVRNYCKENNIKLLEIRYDEDIEKILYENLNDDCTQSISCQ